MRLETAVPFSCYPKDVFSDVPEFCQQGRELSSYGYLELFFFFPKVSLGSLHCAILNQNIITDERKISKQKLICIYVNKITSSYSIQNQKRKAGFSHILEEILFGRGHRASQINQH